MKIRVILQARMNSVRLPGKSMLPISGYPLAILSGLRLSRDSKFHFLAALPATSDCDPLADAFNACKLDVFRGPQSNVLKRFTQASSDLDSSDIIVRATADNVIPDSDLVNLFVSTFISSDLNYLGPKNFFLPLPKGVGVEVFRVASLRTAFIENFHSLDKEHVTFSMARGVKQVNFKGLDTSNWLKKSYSIDTQAEYLVIKKLLEANSNSINATWKEILDECQKV